MKALYFTEGVAPTNAERAEAAKLGIKAFRNAEFSTGVEKCDAVAGAVPAQYLTAKGVQVVKPGPTAEEIAAAEAEAKSQAEAAARTQPQQKRR